MNGIGTPVPLSPKKFRKVARIFRKRRTTFKNHWEFISSGDNMQKWPLYLILLLALTQGIFALTSPSTIRQAKLNEEFRIPSSAIMATPSSVGDDTLAITVAGNAYVLERNTPKYIPGAQGTVVLNYRGFVETSQGIVVFLNTNLITVSIHVQMLPYPPVISVDLKDGTESVTLSVGKPSNIEVTIGEGSSNNGEEDTASSAAQVWKLRTFTRLKAEYLGSIEYDKLAVVMINDKLYTLPFGEKREVLERKGLTLTAQPPANTQDLTVEVGYIAPASVGGKIRPRPSGLLKDAKAINSQKINAPKKLTWSLPEGKLVTGKAVLEFTVKKSVLYRYTFMPAQEVTATRAILPFTTTNVDKGESAEKSMGVTEGSIINLEDGIQLMIPQIDENPSHDGCGRVTFQIIPPPGAQVTTVFGDQSTQVAAGELCSIYTGTQLPPSPPPAELPEETEKINLELSEYSSHGVLFPVGEMLEYEFNINGAEFKASLGVTKIDDNVAYLKVDDTPYTIFTDSWTLVRLGGINVYMVNQGHTFPGFSHGRKRELLPFLISKNAPQKGSKKAAPEKSEEPSSDEVVSSDVQSGIAVQVQVPAGGTPVNLLSLDEPTAMELSIPATVRMSHGGTSVLTYWSLNAEYPAEPAILIYDGKNNLRSEIMLSENSPATFEDNGQQIFIEVVEMSKKQAVVRVTVGKTAAALQSATVKKTPEPASRGQGAGRAEASQQKGSDMDSKKEQPPASTPKKSVLKRFADVLAKWFS